MNIQVNTNFKIKKINKEINGLFKFHDVAAKHNQDKLKHESTYVQ